MLDSDICNDLNARLGGAPIAVCGDEELFAALSSEGDPAFSKSADGCGAVIFAEADGADYAALAAGRPFIIVSERAEELGREWGCACAHPVPWDEGALNGLLRLLAGEFAVLSVGVDIPEWMRFMPADSSAIAELLKLVRERCGGIKKFADLAALDGMFADAGYWSPAAEIKYDFPSGSARVTCAARDGIFFEMLSEIAGDKIEGEYSLMKYVRSAAEAKRGYDKVRDALECARVNGYGVVSPSEDDLVYEQPDVVRQGGSVGIRLRASAPSYHVIRVDVSGEVSPIMGDGAQSESLVSGMMKGFESDPEATWNTDVFGRSLKSMVKDGLGSKVNSIRDDTRAKLRRAITRMVNEGKGGVICIIL